MTRRLSAFALTLALLPAGAAWAHGGEDHGEPAPAVTTPAKAAVSRAAATERFELVLTLDTPQTGAARHVHLYLSDYATNAPVGGASLTIDWGSQVTGEAKATAQAGIYESTVTFPAAGEYSPLVTVAAAGTEDLITLDAIPVTPAPGAPTGNRLLWLAGAALVLAAAAAVWWRQPRRRSDSPQVEAHS